MIEPADSIRQAHDDLEISESPEEETLAEIDDEAAIPLSDGIHDGDDLEALTAVAGEDDVTPAEAIVMEPVEVGSAEPEEVIALGPSSDQTEAVDVVLDSVDEELPEVDDVTPPSTDEDTLTPPPTETSIGSRFGRMFGRGKSKVEETTSSTDASAEVGSGDVSSGARIRERLRTYLDPGVGHIDLTWHRRMVGVVLVLVLILLAANQAGPALIVASAVIPVLIVMLLTRYDVFERESNLILAGLGAIGIVVGVVLGSVVSWVVGNQWFSGGHLNFGAGGFGGNFAPGAAPFLVWLVAGLLVPAAIVAGTAAAPIVLRRKPQFANEVMDGVTLAGASAAGIAIGLAATFWYPMVTGDGPLMSVSDWTLTVMGQVLLRPLVITLCGAMIGAGVWRYMITASTGMTAVLPTAAGVLGLFLLWLSSVATQSSGIWAEFQMTLFLALLVFVLYRQTLVQAIETDSLAMGNDGERIVCPLCHQVTPVGAFCARCGQPLVP